MWIIYAIVILILILLVNREYFDTKRVIDSIGKATPRDQRYGDFMQQYGLNINPWQYQQLKKLHRSGNLNDENANSILSLKPVQIAEKAEAEADHSYLGPGTSVQYLETQ